MVIIAKDSKGEQHQLKELKGVSGKDSKGEQHQLKELKGVAVVYDRIHIFGLGSDTETETENWPNL